MPNLVSRAVREGLYTHIVGRRILYYPELGSTMDEAARLAAEGADEGTVVIAEVQTAGRGRQAAAGFPVLQICCSPCCFGPMFPSCPISASLGVWRRHGLSGKWLDSTLKSSGPTT